MRIVSWNVNGIRAVEKKGFIQWLREESPDILCLQETKARPEQLSKELIEPTDRGGRAYRSYWASARKPGYAGVAIYSKKKPLEIKTLGLAEFDDE
ncbi:MAG: endonuclease/exonuclease/phosphatase family protein, partial [Treponema sp.]|nr:endonuclease/exonuclease/phosphatase family protein [Treponema sp.]